jgi:plastocyanin
MRGDFFKRVLVPAMIPLGAFVFIGALVFGFSRILLAVPKDGSVVVGVLIAGCILFAAGAVAKGGKIKLQQRTALVAFAMLVLVGGVATGLSIGTRPIEGHLEVAATITAQNIKFDKTELDLPATPFILELDNKDSVPHNVAIYDKPPSSPGAKTFFQPPLQPGPKVAEFEVTKPIPVGVWYFQCDAHTTMHGIARVGGAKGIGPGGSPAPTTAPSALPSPPPGGGATAFSLVAKNLSFDKKELTFVANKLVALELDNQDAGILHNWALYRDSAYTQLIFKGDPPVTGPAKRTYRFQVPGPGTYYFQCDFHPNPAMRGTVTVR